MTRKGRHFIWGEDQQATFEEIKKGLQKPPVLHMPDRRGRFLLHSDTSKHATGSALYQVQNGKPNLLHMLVKECQKQLRTTSFSHLLKWVDFDAIVDHLAIMYIMKSMMEPTTNRIKRFLELLSSYSFNLYYLKGKDMV